MKISIKLRVFSDRLFERSHREGGLIGRGGGQQCGGGNSGGGGRDQQWGVFSTSKNRPSHHKYKSLKQFELKGSKST